MFLLYRLSLRGVGSKLPANSCLGPVLGEAGIAVGCLAERPAGRSGAGVGPGGGRIRVASGHLCIHFNVVLLVGQAPVLI